LKNLVVFILISLGQCAFSQNLITNPGFEEIDSCYGAVAGLGFDVFEWSGCDNWTCPSTGSSDLWCENPALGNVTPPQLYSAGYQLPHDGENMAGILIFELANMNSREYIQYELEQPLENKYYQFSLYVSPAEQGLGYENYSNCLQAYFSNFSLTWNDYYSLNVDPQWKNEQWITDTSRWTKLEGLFKANGGEKFITIGCFEDSASISVDNKNPFTTSDIYYLLDDVYMAEVPFLVSFPNAFTPNEDGVNDLFYPKIENVPDYEVYIYNRWGNLMTVLTENAPTWSGDHHPEGTYFYLLENEVLNIKEQGFFQLIR